MTRLPAYLLGFLCLQLVLALAIYWQGQQQSDLQQAQPLLSFNRDTLDKIVIMDAEQTATLVKEGDNWVLPGLDGLAVNQVQLDSAVEKLAVLTTNWPIATTPSSHRRFELEEDNFQHRIQLFQQDNKVVDLLLGSSPSFRKVHLRVLDDNTVYELPLNTFDFPAKDAQWMDKTLLAVSDVTAIQGNDYRLTKEQDKWALQSPSKESIPLDQDKAIGLEKALSTLRVLGLASQPPVLFGGRTMKTLKIEAAQPRHYQLLKLNDDYYIKSRDMSQVFSLSQTDYQRIAGVDLSGLTLNTSSERDAKVETNAASEPVPPGG